MILHLDDGNHLNTIANEICEENFYIQSAELNGLDYNHLRMDHKTIMNGAKMEFKIRAEPNRNRRVNYIFSITNYEVPGDDLAALKTKSV